MNNRKFPIGVQNFEKIRKGDFLWKNAITSPN